MLDFRRVEIQYRMIRPTWRPKCRASHNQEIRLVPLLFAVVSADQRLVERQP